MTRTMRVCIWLLEQYLPADVAEHVVGDLMERHERGCVGPLRLLYESLAAIWYLHDRPQPGESIVSTFFADLRIAARLLRRSPAFTLVATLTLGVAIGATTAIFSVIEPVLLRPLPYPSPDRLAFVWERDRDGSPDNMGFATIRDLARESRTIERVAAIGDWQPTLSSDVSPERVRGDRVSWTYFRTLGVAPAIGRDFTEEEDAPGRSNVVILSYGLWQRRFGGDSSIVGKSISINGNPATVAGVMPAAFDNVASPTTEIWRVLGYRDQPFACRTCHHLRMLVRVRPGVTMHAMQSELDGIHARLERMYPKEYESIGVSLVGLQEQMTTEFRPALLVLGAAVLLVLLIAAANVVNLQLARSVGRQEEFAVRAALGAGRGRLTRQLLTEGLLLAGIGGSIGIVTARLALPVLVSYLPMELPRAHAIHVDSGALLLVTVAVLALSIAMGLAPGRQRLEDLATAMRAGRRLSGAANRTTRATLVVAEVALATMLLISAGLVGRSLMRILDVNAGFDPSHLLTMEINSTGPKYPDYKSVFQFHQRVLEAVRAIPGVELAATSNQLPLGGNMDRYAVVDPANPPVTGTAPPSGDRYVVSVDYLRTMRIPILRGRTFTAAEAADTSNPVALVSAELAERLWPGIDPLGKAINVGGPSLPARRVIGVVGNVRHMALDATVTMQWYAPDRQWPGTDNQEVLIVRAHGDPIAIASAVRRAVSSIDPTQPIVRLATMDQVIARSTAQRRLALVLIGAFAIAALVLAVAGIYGVLAGSVAERTREIGIRSALGATPGEILRLVLGQGGRLGAVGIVVGVAASLLATRFLRALLFGIGPGDPVTLVGVVVLLGTVMAVACLVPGVRATRVDPSVALRSE